jgi:hypothetical protein
MLETQENLFVSKQRSYKNMVGIIEYSTRKTNKLANYSQRRKQHESSTFCSGMQRTLDNNYRLRPTRILHNNNYVTLCHCMHSYATKVKFILGY